MVDLIHLDLAHPRDLVMISAVFAVATFAWAGWAQESPPERIGWRVALAGLSVAGVALAALAIPVAIRHWDSATAIAPDTRGFTIYLVVFWAEVIVGAALALIAIRAGRAEWIAPMILAVVGIHFFALAVVLQQPMLHIVAGVLTAVAVLAALLPRDIAAPSFWCGALGGPVFLGVGVWCWIAGQNALAVS